MGIGKLSKIYIDVSDLETSGRFWGKLLGMQPSISRQDPLGGWFLDLLDTDGNVNVVLQKVQEKHTVKNRVHLDLDVGDLRTAIRSVEEAGGRLIKDMPSGFAVMADPDGNEFCLIPPD